MVPAMHPLANAWLASLISVARRVPLSVPCVSCAGADMRGANLNLFFHLLPSHRLKPLSFPVAIALQLQEMADKAVSSWLTVARAKLFRDFVSIWSTPLTNLTMINLLSSGFS